MKTEEVPAQPDVDNDDDFVYTPYITVKGRRIYAHWYGLKAFRFKPRDKNQKG